MREIYLDGRAMATREMAHDLLSQALSFPPYYGRNLDALHDCLTDIAQPTRLTIRHASDLTVAQGRYGEQLLRVLRDVAAENGNLTVSIA